ncbi:Nif3-like dinuclear metal center hexameric protein [Guyparkeria hydrothermalis]|uniref:GTP cyclohydrolase 1 type 2 homolog n=1 Tax=Guyparkeria halophila TaxID=47960 RepID=A0A6I6D3M2_9GAMM|nr:MULTISPECIES: Nif3-like dinuclear metal center hexameric protein [Guyparkeria]MCL7751736.1 Nif3-like dinuclear metal center hexameric protein [Guyparkeria hydrothermalis]QGT78543.1 Nif3-like dinuclear metal center hexameric protein [Guyparkeria halophila]
MPESVDIRELLSYCEGLLEPETYRDYAPNGLQVEGRAEIRRLVTGVTACQALLDAAVEAQADAVLVHHGYFWKNEPATITGMKRRRIATLLTHDINLIGYHLPLDGHDEIGNNAWLARTLGMNVTGRFGHQQLAVSGRLEQPATGSELAARIAECLGRAPLVVGPTDRPIHRIGLCTGGAQDMLGEAIDLGLDAFISGEISERTTHLAREAGVTYFAAGHHATETGGVRLLGERIADEFDIEHRFIDIPNPV